jgi:hypothetical protein
MDRSRFDEPESGERSPIHGHSQSEEIALRAELQAHTESGDWEAASETMKKLRSKEIRERGAKIKQDRRRTNELQQMRKQEMEFVEALNKLQSELKDHGVATAPVFEFTSMSQWEQLEESDLLRLLRQIIAKKRSLVENVSSELHTHELDLPTSPMDDHSPPPGQSSLSPKELSLASPRLTNRARPKTPGTPGAGPFPFAPPLPTRSVSDPSNASNGGTGRALFDNHPDGVPLDLHIDLNDDGEGNLANDDDEGEEEKAEENIVEEGR